MILLVYSELVQVLHFLYSRFIKLKVIQLGNMTSKFLKLDPKTWCDPGNIDIGVGTNKYIHANINYRENR